MKSLMHRGLLALLVAGPFVDAADYPLKPVPFHAVEMTSAFWRPRPSLESGRQSGRYLLHFRTLRLQK